MASSSLNKFSVPLSSDQSSSSQGLLMPKLQYRFRILFENMGVSTPRSELTKQVVSASRPNVSFDPVLLNVYNSRIKLAGKHTWAAMQVTLRDDMAGAVTKIVGEQLQKQFDYMEQASASSGIDYKFTTKLEMLDGGNGAGEPVVIEAWELYGCYISTADYGQVDYSSSEPATIVLTLEFDNAIQTPQGSGIGAAVGRTLGTVTTG